MRRCPRCNVELSPLFNGRVELDHCRLCRGNFLDVGKAAHTFGPWVEPTSWIESHCAARRGTSKLRCPADHSPLEAYDVSWGDEHVEVDVCSTCKGLWLDAHEGGRLARIVGAHHNERHAAENLPSAKAYFFQLVTGFPIEVWNPVRRPPVLVYALIALLTLVFLGQVAAFVLLGPQGVERLLAPFLLVPGQVTRGHQLWSLLTHAFLHGGVAHLLGNLYFLWIFGDNVEDQLGKRRFLLLYLVAALGGAALHFAVDPYSQVPMLGASGAISGVMGAYLLLFPRVKVWVVLFFVRFKISIYWYLGFWVAMQVGMAALGTPGVAWYAHLGGFAAGALAVLAMRRRARE